MSLNLNASPHVNDTSIIFTEIQNLTLNRIFVYVSSHPVLDLVLFKLFFLFPKTFGVVLVWMPKYYKISCVRHGYMISKFNLCGFYFDIWSFGSNFQSLYKILGLVNIRMLYHTQLEGINSRFALFLSQMNFHCSSMSKPE